METVSLARAADTSAMTANRMEAEVYLASLLSKMLLLHTDDGRIFHGEFMCTDPNRNIVLAHANEYHQPTAEQLAEKAAQTGQTGKLLVDMKPRYLGLIVVPGQHIAKIEVEEFVSQMKK